MNVTPIIARLEGFPAALRAAAACVPDADARFKPPSGVWSILEIVCHLGDEEVEDFRARLAFVLDRTPGEWPPIDPEGWARERRYNEKDRAAAVSRFIDERRASVAWLRSVPAATDWSLAYQHPKFGPIRAGDLLASWAAHDALHLRQIAKRLWELAARDAPDYRTAYAGEWRA
jgi:DinB superfamily